MIIKYKVKNFGSFKESVELNLEKKSKESKGQEFIVEKNRISILNCLALIGVNGSGKTTMLNSLFTMKDMILTSQNFLSCVELPYNPFIGEKDKPTEFEIFFEFDNMKYEYKFSYTQQKIIDESCYVYNPQRKKIFVRRGQKFEFGREYSKYLKPIRIITPAYVLFMSRLSQTNLEIIKPFFKFLKNIRGSFNVLDIYNETWELLKNKKIKEKFVECLNKADMSIEDCFIERKKVISLPDSRNIDSKINYFGKEISDLILVHKHKKKRLPVSFLVEAKGTQIFIQVIYNLLLNDKNTVLIFDEIENSLNIEIVIHMIKIFSKQKNLQLIFTTHQPDILNELRSDQIKIFEKHDSISSIIELHEITKTEPNMRKNYGTYYREGVLGGWPKIID